MTARAIRSSVDATGPLRRVAIILLAALSLSLSPLPGKAVTHPSEAGLFAPLLKPVALKPVAPERAAHLLKAPAEQPDREPKWTGPGGALSSPGAAPAGMRAPIRAMAVAARQIGRYPARPASQGPPAPA